MKNHYLNFCKLATLVLMLGLSFKFFSVSTSTFEVSAQASKVTICHAAGQDGTTHFNTISVGYPAAYGPAGHFYENGTPRAGHEDDYLGECRDENEEESEDPSMSSIVSCGQIDMIFNNPTPWFFSFDYRIDGEAGHDDAYTNMVIANGLFAGELFGQRFNEVDVVTNTSQSKTVTFPEDSGTHSVSYRLFRGAENDLYLNWENKEIGSDCETSEECRETVSCDDSCRTESVTIQGVCDPIVCESNAESCDNQDPSPTPVVDPSPTPTPTVTPSPTPTEPPGYNCPVAQSCPSSCGKSASEVPNGSCGFNHCDPTPSCDGGIGGGSQGQVLGASTMSGQVLGASTYAATGVVEDMIFSLVGVAGAGLSGAGILLKRDAKSKK